MGHIDFVEITSVFVVLLAIIDITGSIPIFLGLKQQGKLIDAGKATLASAGIFLAFFLGGTALLGLFGVHVETFAVAGSIVLFIIAFEMAVGVEIMKYDEKTDTGASIVPVAFPLIAGPGALTAILALQAKYAVINIMIGLAANLVLAYVVLKYIDKLGALLGGTTVYIIRKFFGVVLLAVAIQMFASNLTVVIQEFAK